MDDQAKAELMRVAAEIVMKIEQLNVEIMRTSGTRIEPITYNDSNSIVARIVEVYQTLVNGL